MNQYPQVYLLHFDRPYWSNCKHYVGYSVNGAETRVATHRSGKGSLLVNFALTKANVDFKVALVETWATKEEARERELWLKTQKNLKRVCPICQSDCSVKM